MTLGALLQKKEEEIFWYMNFAGTWVYPVYVLL